MARADHATRRGFLAAVAGAVGTVTAGTATADLETYADAKPSHVSISYDEATLSTYQPSLAFPSQMNIRPSTIYAWTSASPEYRYDAHTYVVYYQSQQTSLSTTSHRHDREIVQVYTHPEFGEVREAVYSAGHWAAYRNESPNVYQPDGGGQHVQLRVHPEYRHYQGTDTVGSTDIDLQPLGTDETLFTEGGDATQFEVFLENGWDPLLDPGMLQDANRARFATDYWSSEAPWVDQFAAANASWLASSFAAPFIAPELQGSDFDA